MATMRELMAEATRLGISVHLAHLPDPYLGIYAQDESAIYLRLGLPFMEMKATFAHELGHAFYSHPCSTGSNERLADRHAARLLIDTHDYRQAEAINPDPWAIADELSVTVEVVENYQRYWLMDRIAT